MAEPVALSTPRAVATYGATSLLLAVAWHVNVPGGLWIVNALAAIVGVALAWWTLGSDWGSIFGWSARSAARGIALGLLLVAATQLSARLLLPLMPGVAKETHRLYGLLQSTPGAPRALPIIALVVVAEELVYRSVVTSLCLRHMSVTFTIVCSTLLYALPLAASGSWLLCAIGLTLGTFWTLARIGSNSLTTTLLCHFMWSCSTFVVFPFGL
jgi:uncharacterized protein